MAMWKRQPISRRTTLIRSMFSSLLIFFLPLLYLPRTIRFEEIQLGLKKFLVWGGGNMKKIK